MSIMSIFKSKYNNKYNNKIVIYIRVYRKICVIFDIFDIDIRKMRYSIL